MESISKQNFQCHKFSTGEIYFGETCYVNAQNEIIVFIFFFIIHSKDINTPDLPEEEKSKLIRVRHGTGIQFYTPLDQEDFISKYEGEWKLNQRNGQGKN